MADDADAPGGAPPPPAPAEGGVPVAPLAPVALRATPSHTRGEEWGLVLASAGIAFRLDLDRAAGLFVLVVGAADATAARQALEAFDVENVPVPQPPALDLGPSVLGVGFAVLLAAFYLVAGGRDDGGAAPSRWFAAGSASAELILRGQWWRAVTALTLHGDLLHIAGNLVASLLFVSAVGRWLGAGLGAAVVLVSAAAANLLVALSHRTAFVSVGASTATFAALGILAGLQLVRRWRGGARWRRAWLPLGAALGLYAMTGVGPNTDMRAHLFGMGVGALAGAALGAARVRPPRWLGQVALGLAALGALAGCWALALRGLPLP